MVPILIWVLVGLVGASGLVIGGAFVWGQKVFTAPIEGQDQNFHATDIVVPANTANTANTVNSESRIAKRPGVPQKGQFVSLFDFEKLSWTLSQTFVMLNTTFRKDYEALLEKVYTTSDGLKVIGINVDEKNGSVHCAVCKGDWVVEQVVGLKPCNHCSCKDCDFSYRILPTIYARYEQRTRNIPDEEKRTTSAAELLDQIWKQVLQEIKAPDGRHGNHVRCGTCHSDGKTCHSDVKKRVKYILNATAPDNNNVAQNSTTPDEHINDSNGIEPFGDAHERDAVNVAITQQELEQMQNVV